jgi:hypothetical protein
MYRLITLTSVLASEPAFVPQASLTDLRHRGSDAKAIEQRGYEALVNLANSAIDERIGKTAEGPLFDKFKAYYLTEEFSSLLNEVAKDIICRSTGEDLLTLLKQQGVIAPEVEKTTVCLQDPMSDSPAHAPVSVTCPIDGTPFQPIAESSSSVKADYDRLLLEDCVYKQNVNQITLDSQRVPVIRFLLQTILEENAERISIATTAGVTGGSFAESSALTLANSQRRSYEIAINQLQFELTQMIDICSEVSFIYSSFGRRVISREATTIPFLYYQGIASSCYYVLLFSRQSAGKSASKGTPATYPLKAQAYNMVAAIVEDVNAIPLGNPDYIEGFYSHVLERLVAEICRILGPASPVSEKRSIFRRIGGKFARPRGGSIDTDGSCTVMDPDPMAWTGLYAFIISTSAIGVHRSTDINPQVLPKVWGFIFEHGHYGLMAVFAACYKELSDMIDDEGQSISGIQIQTALEIMNTSNKIDAMLDIAQKLVSSPTWKEIVDKIELEVQLMLMRTTQDAV